MTPFMRSLLLGAALMLPASTTFAACTNADLVGRWRYISTWISVDESAGLMSVPLAVDCHLRLSRSGGTVTVDNCNGSDDADTFVGLFGGWKPTLTSGCGLRSCIEPPGNHAEFCHRGQLSQDKQMLHGTVRATLDRGRVRGSFSLVKR